MRRRLPGPVCGFTRSEYTCGVGRVHRESACGTSPRGWGACGQNRGGELGRVIHAIVNPRSGAGWTRWRWPRIAQRLDGAGVVVRSYVTSAPDEATRLTRDLLCAGVPEILSVGGDGTANEVANGFLRDGRPIAPDAVLSLMPTGTGHDFARSLGIASTTDALAALLDGHVRAVDVGWIDYRGPDGRAQRCFVNAADVGIGAVAAARINRSSKLLGGFLTYLVGAARTIVTARPRLARVVIDGVPVLDGPVQMILIANGGFHAGGMRMAPGASLTDGQFEVLVLQGVPRTALLGSILPRAYRGTHIRHPAIVYGRGREVEVSADEPLPFEMDGESPGTTDLTARVLPGALRVRVPHAA